MQLLPNLLHMPRGVVPLVIPLTSAQDEMTRVVNEVRRLVEQGTPCGDILLIHASWEETRRLEARLNRALGAETAVDPTQAMPRNQIRVCALNAATAPAQPSHTSHF